MVEHGKARQSRRRLWMCAFLVYVASFVVTHTLGSNGYLPLSLNIPWMIFYAPLYLPLRLGYYLIAGR